MEIDERFIYPAIYFLFFTIVVAFDIYVHKKYIKIFNKEIRELWEFNAKLSATCKEQCELTEFLIGLFKRSETTDKRLEDIKKGMPTA